ncbi:hypothetical protein HND97_16370 [Vibrio cholerae]|nr:hypothetical protein HND97_16370 [Vibrio cholerae]
MQTCFYADPESILGTLARLFAAKGAAREVAVLTYSSPEVKESYYDNWNGGTTHYTLYLHVPINLYPQLESDLAEIENTILENAGVYLSNFENEKLSTKKLFLLSKKILNGVIKRQLGYQVAKLRIKVVYVQIMLNL